MTIRMFSTRKSKTESRCKFEKLAGGTTFSSRPTWWWCTQVNRLEPISYPYLISKKSFGNVGDHDHYTDNKSKRKGNSIQTSRVCVCLVNLMNKILAQCTLKARTKSSNRGMEKPYVLGRGKVSPKWKWTNKQKRYPRRDGDYREQVQNIVMVFKWEWDENHGLRGVQRSSSSNLVYHMFENEWKRGWGEAPPKVLRKTYKNSEPPLKIKEQKDETTSNNIWCLRYVARFSPLRQNTGPLEFQPFQPTHIQQLCNRWLSRRFFSRNRTWSRRQSREFFFLCYY